MASEVQRMYRARPGTVKAGWVGARGLSQPVQQQQRMAAGILGGLQAMQRQADSAVL